MLEPLWLITGSELLLQLESVDLLRKHARELGYTDRQTLEMNGSSDWTKLFDSAAEIGMFDERKFLEVRIPTGRPGQAGSKMIERFLKLPPLDGVIVVFQIPKPDWQGVKATWWKSLNAACTVVDCEDIPRQDLPRWLAERMARNSQRASREALEHFADLVEGNLLAAVQEVAKLALLFPEGELTDEQISSSVASSSRYSADSLMKSICLGEKERAARIIDGLEAQAEPFPLLLMILTTQIRNIIKLRQAYDNRQTYVPGVFATPELKKAARRLTTKRLSGALSVCADIDRLSKGLLVPSRDSDPWIELKSVALFLAS